MLLNFEWGLSTVCSLLVPADGPTSAEAQFSGASQRRMQRCGVGGSEGVQTVPRISSKHESSCWPAGGPPPWRGLLMANERWQTGISRWSWCQTAFAWFALPFIRLASSEPRMEDGHRDGIKSGFFSYFCGFVSAESVNNFFDFFESELIFSSALRPQQRICKVAHNNEGKMQNSLAFSRVLS